MPASGEEPAAPTHPRGVSHGPGRRLAVFFVLACAFSWAWWLPLVSAGRTVGPGADPSHFPGLLGPMLAALAVVALTGGRDGLRNLLGRMVRWRVGWPWWLAALSPLTFLAVAVGLVRLLDGQWPNWADLGRVNGLPDAGVLVVWALLVLVNGFGEETGWRGFALPMLQQNHSPLAASLRLVPLWAFWHLPTFRLLVSFAGFDPGTAVGWILGLTAGSVVLTWLYNRSGGSILMVALWHGVYNAAAAPEGARGMIAAVVTTAVMVQAVMLVVLELRAQRAGARSVLGPPADDHG